MSHLPPLPWVARGNRIYAADGEEIAVATKASPKHRTSANVTAAAIVARINGTVVAGWVRVTNGGYLKGKVLPILSQDGHGRIHSKDPDGYAVLLVSGEYERVPEPNPTG